MQAVTGLFFFSLACLSAKASGLPSKKENQISVGFGCDAIHCAQSYKSNQKQGKYYIWRYYDLQLFYIIYGWSIL